MAKGQKRGNRETKKPKTAVKAAPAHGATSFLRPGPVAAPGPGSATPAGRGGKR